MSDEALTFSELRKIQKKERRQENLTELDPNFLLQVGDYLDRKKDIDEKSREYRNAQRVFRKILSLREDKIVKNARLSLKSNIKPSEMNMLPREEQLFREMREKFEEHRERIDEVTRNGGNVKDSGEEDEELDEESVEQEVEDEVPKEDDEEESGRDTKEGYEFVKIKAEVPEFMGTDLEAYGPFEEGDEAEIPEDNAEILVNRGNAERMS